MFFHYRLAHLFIKVKIIAFNQTALDTAYQEMSRILEENKGINLDFSAYKKPKTLRQLGFLFGALVNAIVQFYHEKGEDSWTDSAVTELLYQALSPKVKMVRFNGEIYEHPKHISEMDREEMSKFIDGCINLIDRASCFKGLILHPSVRYTWVNHITKEELKEMDTSKFPRSCPEYLEYRRKQCCLVCGRYGCEAHHIRESEEAGVARKANDTEVISLCKLCHAKYHDMGSEQFRKNLWWILNTISLEDFVACCYNRWYNGFR